MAKYQVCQRCGCMVGLFDPDGRGMDMHPTPDECIEALSLRIERLEARIQSLEENPHA